MCVFYGAAKTLYFFCPARSHLVSPPMQTLLYYKPPSTLTPPSRLFHARGPKIQGQLNYLLTRVIYHPSPYSWLGKKLCVLLICSLKWFFKRCVAINCRLADHVLLVLRRNRASSRGSGAPRSTNSCGQLLLSAGGNSSPSVDLSRFAFWLLQIIITV